MYVYPYPFDCRKDKNAKKLGTPCKFPKSLDNSRAKVFLPTYIFVLYMVT